MATPLTETIRKVKGFQQDIDQILLSIVEDHEEEVIQLNLDQLAEGMDGNGQEIRPPYAASTKRRKRRKGQPTEFVTLKDTGRFYGRVFLQFQEDRFFFAADVYYLKDLVKKYGRNILGLDGPSVSQVGAIVRRQLPAEFKKRTLL